MIAAAERRSIKREWGAGSLASTDMRTSPNPDRAFPEKEPRMNQPRPKGPGVFFTATAPDGLSPAAPHLTAPKKSNKMFLVSNR